MVTISVALCTYNGARFVGAQLRSILEQTMLPSEVIISDDGSTDGTLDRVRETFARYGTEATALRILNPTGQPGVTANFQRAVTACTGDLIALSDQDDLWHPNRLAAAVPGFDDPAVLLQHSNARLVDAAGEPLGVSLLEALRVSAAERELIDGGKAFGALIRRNLATGATILFRRELLDRALPFPLEWVHDEWLAIIAAAVGRVQLLDAELIDYRQHGSNQIGVRKPTLRYRLGRMFEPRGDRHPLLAARSAVLASRLRALPVAAGLQALADDRARFDAVRAALPRSRWRRVGPVLREWRNGSYLRLSSQGTLDVARDLLQPA